MQLEIFMTKSKGKTFFKILPVEKIPFVIHSAVTQTFFSSTTQCELL
jgi:hypothetical protein